MKRWLIFVLVVLLLAGGAGVAIYSWDKNRNNQANTSQTSKQSDPSEGGKYLYIKEWGVRFKLPEELVNSVSYKPNALSTDEDFILETRLLESPDCMAFGFIRRTEPNYLKDDQDGKNKGTYKKIGGYYYERIVGVIACSDREEVHRQAADIQQKLYQASDTLEEATK